MTVTTLASSTYGYQMPSYDASQKEGTIETARESYGTHLLPKLDERAYTAFLNATQDYSVQEKKEAARMLEHAAALSAAQAYAQSHKSDAPSDLATIYNYFEHYYETVSTPQIKHLLNTKLYETTPQNGTVEPTRFFEDYLAQLGEVRRLDLRV